MRRGSVFLLLSLSLAACPNASNRGIEQPGSAQARSATQSKCKGPATDAWTPTGFCVTRFASDLVRPRHLVVAPTGELLVATRSGVVALWDDDGDGTASEHERATFGIPDVSHHGIALSPDGRWVYVADSKTVRRIALDAGPRKTLPGPGEIVIPDVPLTVTHPYRTITFDAKGRLLLVVGSEDNITAGAGAVVMRYTLGERLPLAFASGEKLAVGLRNGEALAWDREGKLWAFVNGRDYLHPAGTSDAFYLDHPGDAVVRLSDTPGTFYGFPHCWVLGPVAWAERRDPASQWADPEANQGHDDAWCQNPANVAPAAGSLAAHTSPLGAVFYTGNTFPRAYADTFFVTSHGSWNRHRAQYGRSVLAVHVSDGRVTKVETIVGERGKDGNLHEGTWAERPVGIAQRRDGALYFTSDETGHVMRLGYAP